MNNQIDWIATCERQHAERVQARNAMKPSTCKRPARLSFFARILRALSR